MIVGTSGHIDHGKTALVKALTGVDTDRLKEEKARGITIDLGFAYLPRPDGSVIGFVDVPGHERFIRTMVAGAHGIDFVLLVIAADDGVMPQTREHLEILDLLGLTRGLVALSKADLVDADTLMLRELEIAEALMGTTLEGADVLPVSVVTRMGLRRLTERLDQEAARTSGRDVSRAFRLAVDRSFTLTGTGTVVTGTVVDGSAAVGDQVTVSPSGLPARIRSIHVQNGIAPTARAGDRAALNLAGPGIAKESVGRGDMVLAGSIHAPTSRIDAELRVLAGEKKPLAQWMPVRLHSGTAEVGARVIHLGRPPEPGQVADVQLVLDHPVAVCDLDRFILRDVSQTRTIGGGRFLDTRAPVRQRRTPERARIRDAMRQTNAAATLSGLLEEPPFALTLPDFLAARCLREAAGSDLINHLDLVELRADGVPHVASRPVLDRRGEEAIVSLQAHHLEHPDQAGMSVDHLRRLVAPRTAAPLFRAILTHLRGTGQIAVDGPWARLPSHTVALTPKDEALWSQIIPLLSGEERFRPPRVRDIATALGLEETAVRMLMRKSQRAGRVDEIAHDHFFTRATSAEMVSIVQQISAAHDQGWFPAAAFRDRVGIGRKVAIQILEFLDRHGVTHRRGDLRRPNLDRLDLFPEMPASTHASLSRPDLENTPA